VITILALISRQQKTQKRRIDPSFHILFHFSYASLGSGLYVFVEEKCALWDLRCFSWQRIRDLWILFWRSQSSAIMELCFSVCEKYRGNQNNQGNFTIHRAINILKVSTLSFLVSAGLELGPGETRVSAAPADNGIAQKYWYWIGKGPFNDFFLNLHCCEYTQ